MYKMDSFDSQEDPMLKPPVSFGINKQDDIKLKGKNFKYCKNHCTFNTTTLFTCMLPVRHS